MTTPTKPTPHAPTPHAQPASQPASHSPAPIIEARSLTKHFGGTRQLFMRAPTVYAVNEVSFAVQAGETFAIVGESGCGKSTLGRLLLRLIDSTDGRVFYQGKDITHEQGAPLRRLRREMQIIFQDPFASLNPGMTIGKIVGEPIALHGLAHDSAGHRERVATAAHGRPATGLREPLPARILRRPAATDRHRARIGR